MTTLNIITAALLMAGIWSILCRFARMQPGRTQPVVFWQHLVLGLGMAAALLLPPYAGKLAMAFGVAAFLLAGAPRWRYAAPPGTETGPAEFDSRPWQADGGAQ